MSSSTSSSFQTLDKSKEQVIIITGVLGGIGCETAKRYWYDLNWVVVGIDCRDEIEVDMQKSFLDVYATLKTGILEAAEKLEQLRILEHGYRIGIIFTKHNALGVDTEEDLEKVKKLME